MKDITDVSVFDLAKEEYGNAWHIEDGLALKVTYLGEEISYLLFSPSKRKAGFYHDKPGDEYREPMGSMPQTILLIADFLVYWEISMHI